MLKQAFLSFNKENKFTLRDMDFTLELGLESYSIITTSLERDKHIVQWCKELGLDCIVINKEYWMYRVETQNIIDNLSLIIIDYKDTVDIDTLHLLGNSKLDKESKLDINIMCNVGSSDGSFLYEVVCGIRWLQLDMGFDFIDKVMSKSRLTFLETQGLDDNNQVVLTELNKIQIETICGLSEIAKIQILEMAESVV